jgi:nicotinate-nucleotide adenylyltransferase
MRIGILGGTFDPIHVGHLSMARHAKAQFDLDKVIFIPAFLSPHKKNADKITSSEHRARMVSLALASEETMEMCDTEIKRPRVSYTVDTLRELKKKYPSDDFYLIMGQDSYEHFSSWHKPDEIRRMAQIAVAPREGNNQPLSGALSIAMEKMNVSSSYIRSELAKKSDKIVNLLAPGVLTYIGKHGLYQSDPKP